MGRGRVVSGAAATSVCSSMLGQDVRVAISRSSSAEVYNNFKYVKKICIKKQREKHKKKKHGNYFWPGPTLEADKSFSIGAVKMPQTAHYKRQNKFMQIAGNTAKEKWKKRRMKKVEAVNILTFPACFCEVGV